MKGEKRFLEEKKELFGEWKTAAMRRDAHVCTTHEGKR